MPDDFGYLETVVQDRIHRFIRKQFGGEVANNMEDKNKPVPCKHLDFTLGKYGPDINLRTNEEGYKYWERGPLWLEPDGRNARDVQFCTLRGRINHIRACYKGGSMPCFKESEDE